MTPFTIGAEVACSDGSCGELTRVVIDPIARTVTHLVVDPKHRLGLGHLVPIELVAMGGEDITLKCTAKEFASLENAEETQFLPRSAGMLGYGDREALSWPYYGLGGPSMGGLGLGGLGTGTMGMGMANALQPMVHDRVPMGKVDVRRGEQVHATDGTIGRVQGLVIDPRDHHVTHVLLQEGHLWGRKEVAIPITAVAGVADGIQLTLSKDQVKDLPPVDIEHPDTLHQ